MEEIEKLERQISDLEAEIRVLSAKAESAEDTEDKKYYRALVLKKLDRLLKEQELLVEKEDNLLKEKELLVKEKELLLKEKELLVKKEEKEILLLEKDKDLRKENLLRLQRLGARGSAAGLGVESTAGSGEFVLRHRPGICRGICLRRLDLRKNTRPSIQRRRFSTYVVELS
ncbi:hypothetical protein Vretifemale_13015 [Volvox reticuliferus]|uniref:Uncharacterized protein n=1 Tax=Volvox reticuliferus TaxID=1737510 RepID=A0A8J4CSQ3_9CHLO|nr:hypothetical protein Vretifemale_13015 [Volvox reticuliferus]